MKTKIPILLTLLLLGFMTTVALGQYVVDFEGTGETKGSYASGTVNLSGLDWDMTDYVDMVHLQ